MTEEIIIAGFGGQGVLSMGKILAYSGVMQDKEVSWMPSYGPEMRGGTANVSVIISDERISSPIINQFDTAIILNQQSLDKFENSVKPGGLLIYDPNGITHEPTRKDINIYKIAATAKAQELGISKVFNMVVLGGTHCRQAVHPRRSGALAAPAPLEPHSPERGSYRDRQGPHRSRPDAVTHSIDTLKAGSPRRGFRLLFSCVYAVLSAPAVGRWRLRQGW